MEKWVRANYQPNLPLGEDGRKVTARAEHLALARKAGTEGMVLLKNAGKILPLAKGSRLALFGKGVFDYVKGGGGSGDVTVSHVRNLYDGLKEEKGLAEIYEPLADFYRENVKEQYAGGAVPGMTVAGPGRAPARRGRWLMSGISPNSVRRVSRTAISA